MISNMIAFGFLGSIFMMFRFSKNCRILIRRKDLTDEERARFQARAQRCLAAAGALLGGSILIGIIGSILQ